MHLRSRFGRLLAASALASMAMAGPASGQTNNSGTFKTGEELYQACTSSDDTELDVCDWFIMGVHDAVILHQDMEWAERTVCTPEGVTARELRDKIIAYLESSGDRNFTAVSMVYNALDENYPC